MAIKTFQAKLATTIHCVHTWRSSQLHTGLDMSNGNVQEMCLTYIYTFYGKT